MSIVVKLPSTPTPKERRLHLRDVASEQPVAAVGQDLKSRRVELGIDEAQLAARLKFRVEQLRAIEAGEYSKLPGKTYAVGFVRSYAKFVGLDADLFAERFKSEALTQELSKPAELVFPEAPQTSRWPSGHLLVAGLAAAVVIYGLAQISMPAERAVVPASATTVEPSNVTVVEPPSTKPAAVPSATKDAVEVVAPLPPVQEIYPVIASQDALMMRALAVVSASVATQASESTGMASVAGPSRITLKVLEETYVQVKDSSLRKPQSVLLARVLAPGESFQAPDRQGLVLLTGNAGGIQVEVDGRSAGVLGKSGQVIKRLPLDPAYFLSRISTSQ